MEMLYTPRWRPESTDNVAGGFHGVPEPGQLIAVGRVPYRVVEVNERPFDRWHEADQENYKTLGDHYPHGGQHTRHPQPVPAPHEWTNRPRMVVVEPARGATGDPKERTHFYWPPNRLSYGSWHPIRDPYSVCVDCGLIWPCPCHDADDASRTAGKLLDWYTSILPGCCWACGKPVTGRQQSIQFPGENLLLLGGPPPVFHTARSSKAKDHGSCLGHAEVYERKWVGAGLNRARRLECPGHILRHEGRGADWSCSEAGCPGPDARHGKGVSCSTMYDLDHDPAAGKWFESSLNCGHERYGHRCRSPHGGAA